MEKQEPTTGSPARGTNWWGLFSTVGLFAWVVLWLKREPGTLIESILSWGFLAAIHLCAIVATRRRYGWLYLMPIGLFWFLVVIARSGGITY